MIIVDFYESPKRLVLINGKKLLYETCCTTPVSLETLYLEKGKHYKYMGKSKVVYVNGVKWDLKKVHHFWKEK